MLLECVQYLDLRLTRFSVLWYGSDYFDGAISAAHMIITFDDFAISPLTQRFVYFIYIHLHESLTLWMTRNTLTSLCEEFARSYDKVAILVGKGQRLWSHVDMQ